MPYEDYAKLKGLDILEEAVEPTLENALKYQFRDKTKVIMKGFAAGYITSIEDITTALKHVKPYQDAYPAILRTSAFQNHAVDLMSQSTYQRDLIISYHGMRPYVAPEERAVDTRSEKMHRTRLVKALELAASTGSDRGFWHIKKPLTPTVWHAVKHLVFSMPQEYRKKVAPFFFKPLQYCNGRNFMQNDRIEIVNKYGIFASGITYTPADLIEIDPQYMLEAAKRLSATEDQNGLTTGMDAFVPMLSALLMSTEKENEQKRYQDYIERYTFFEDWRKELEITAQDAQILLQGYKFIQTSKLMHDDKELSEYQGLKEKSDHMERYLRCYVFAVAADGYFCYNPYVVNRVMDYAMARYPETVKQNS